MAIHGKIAHAFRATDWQLAATHFVSAGASEDAWATIDDAVEQILFSWRIRSSDCACSGYCPSGD